MKISVYQYIRIQHTYVMTDAAQGLNAVPDAIKQMHGGLKLFKQLDVASNDKRIGLDTDAAMAEIKRSGYAIQAVKVTFNTPPSSH